MESDILNYCCRKWGTRFVDLPGHIRLRLEFGEKAQIVTSFFLTRANTEHSSRCSALTHLANAEHNVSKTYRVFSGKRQLTIVFMIDSLLNDVTQLCFESIITIFDKLWLFLFKDLLNHRLLMELLAFCIKHMKLNYQYTYNHLNNYTSVLTITNTQTVWG